MQIKKDIIISSKTSNDGRTDVIQLVYSIFRQKNSEIFELAEEDNIGIVGRTSLQSGYDMHLILQKS